jgi:hypothetical protein
MVFYLTLARKLRATHPDADIDLACDRHGGRTRYREELARAFPDAMVRVLGESEQASHYELREGRGSVRVHFETEADARHLPVALSSMTAKYLRELRMARLNAFFAERLPGLAPTAGYVQDGRRFLAEIEPLLASIEGWRSVLTPEQWEAYRDLATTAAQRVPRCHNTKLPTASGTTR